MNEPEILVEARKAPEQPSEMASTMALAMMGGPPGFQGELWEITVVCQHGDMTIPLMLGMCGGPEGPTSEVIREQVDMALKQVREDYLRRARCACSDPYWLRHGPALAMEQHLGPTKVMGHDGQDCFSAN